MHRGATCALLCEVMLTRLVPALSMVELAAAASITGMDNEFRSYGLQVHRPVIRACLYVKTVLCCCIGNNHLLPSLYPFTPAV